MHPEPLSHPRRDGRLPLCSCFSRPTFFRYKNGCSAASSAYPSDLIQVHLNCSYRGCRNHKAECSSLTVFCSSSRSESGHVAQLADHLGSMHTKPWVRSLILCKLNVVSGAHPSIEEMKAVRSEMKGHLRLHGEFEAILGSMRPCLKNKNSQLIT